MTKKTLQQIQDKLEEDKKNLETELASFADKNVHNTEDYKTRFPEYGDKDEENANEIADFNDNLSVERHLEKILRDINTTLVSLKKGIYGKCKYCKKDIDVKRLLARPASSSCVPCKTKLTGIK